MPALQPSLLPLFVLVEKLCQIADERCQTGNIDTEEQALALKARIEVKGGYIIKQIETYKATGASVLQFVFLPLDHHASLATCIARFRSFAFPQRRSDPPRSALGTDYRLAYWDHASGRMTFCATRLLYPHLISTIRDSHSSEADH